MDVLQTLPPLSHRPLRILVVDDDPIHCALAKEWLSGNGNQVDIAENGLGALDALSAQRFDLIVLDLEMPLMDGFEVLSDLSVDAKHLGVPIIVTTSRSDTAAIDEAYRRGATSFVVKPLIWPLLVRQMRYVLNAERLKRGFVALENALA